MKPLSRLLIANRGEIVVRIARTARRMGIATIAICSDADRDAPHVAACDEFVAIGGNLPAESYLLGERIIAAAQAAGAQAIHPGYGFLSENASFAAAVEAARLIFVGPPASAIEAMGDKARARRRMAAAGIPIVPGYDGNEQDEARFLAEARRIGYPVMIKAAAGGGGRGMRRVAHEPELPDALRSAASEAAKAFGDGRLILERAVEEPRHVEMQVIADWAGRVVHLGERDCSVQRRYQKIVEESPSPAVDPVLRERLGQAATAVAHEIGYVGAGTVEFLLDPAGRFYFMEMNTRLQVEHPVTELVTGLDLVELQLRIARGEPLPVEQQEVRLTGHAVEVRLCAEEPADEFLPRTGTVLDWRPDELVRCDHAVRRGLLVCPYYDSMLAKVIAHGTTRGEALDRLARALDRTVLLGVATNRAFLARLLRQAQFADGVAVSTAFVEQHFPGAANRATVPDERTWALAAWLSVAGATESASTARDWRNWTTGRPLAVPWRLERQAPQSLSEQPPQRSGHVLLGQAGATVVAGEHRLEIRSHVPDPCCDGQAEIDGESLPYRYAWQDPVLWLHTRSGDFAFRCRRRESLRRADAGAAGSGDLRAAINGRIVRVAVSVGDELAAGQRVAVLEAMKMEHDVRAAHAGRVVAVAARAGDQVAPGQLLVRIERSH